MINAEEARNISRTNSDYDQVMEDIYSIIRSACQQGDFHVVVKPGHEFKFTCIRELEQHGFHVENVKQGIYPTGDIEIRW